MSTETRLAVTAEPLTYDRHAPQSFCRDLALAETGDNAAGNRLSRHRREMSVELPKVEQRAQADNVRFEYRTNPSSTASTLAPPLWVIEDFATLERPKRVLADLVQHFPLPAGVHSVNLPRLTTGTQVLPQQDGSPVQDRDIVDAASQSIVTTLVGQADASLQVFEQSPPGAHLDWALFKDMSESYDHQLETQMLIGDGTGEHLKGIYNVAPAANQITYTDSTPTGAEMLPFIGKLIAGVANTRKIEPEYLLMRAARWIWLATAVTSGGQPLVSDWGLDGQGILSFSTKFDEAIPTNLGTDGLQDTIFAVRPSDIMLWEGTPRTSVLTGVLSGTLQVRFQFHQSAALIVRYPDGQGFILGTGADVQAGF